MSELLVEECVKAQLLDMLSEVIRMNRVAIERGDDAVFGRGMEFGMSMVLVNLGIDEAASPQRERLGL